MKSMIKQNNSMYALLLAAAVLIGGNIWFACFSGYDLLIDYSTTNSLGGECIWTGLNTLK